MIGPRSLVIMGSGETAPTMARVHRELFDLLAPDSLATVVDTPYGFQENADEISRRTVDYLRTSVGREVGVASYRSADISSLAAASAVARIAESRYVLAGPGSPSYALRHWIGGPIPEAFATVCANGGVVVMASAAALTLGVATIPVYEIYKTGADPTWLPGLDLLGRLTGMRAAVVPHYDNAEGGTHDTRFCYIGERRLRVLERVVPDGTFILGVDGHTALVLDLERRTARVAGLGSVTVRVDGRSAVFPRGTDTTFAALAGAAAALRSAALPGATGWSDPLAADAAAATPDDDHPLRRASLGDEVARHEAILATAFQAGDATGVIAPLLALDELLERRLRAGEDSPEMDLARTTYRSLVVRLGDLATRSRSRSEEGVSDRVRPLVEALLALRARARSDGDWATADVIRASLAEAGVEVRDDPTGSTWSISPRADRARGRSA